MKRRTKERDIKGISTAPESHAELTKEAKAKPIIIKKQKYRLMVYLGENKLPTEYTSHSKKKLEENRAKLEQNDKGGVFTFGEIEKNKVAMGTKIEWTEQTWNPIIGCSKISEGCQNCYAEKMANRLANINMSSYYLHVVKGMNYGTPMATTKPEWNGSIYFVKSALEKPLKWKKPRMIFVCSMGDLFHENVIWNDIDDVFSIIQKCHQHTFQILTKRPDVMRAYFASRGIKNPYLNVFLGVTTENQEQAEKRIPILLEIPAAKRFVSCEPLLSEIDLQNIPPYYRTLDDWDNKEAGIHWVISGPETGPKSRPMQKEWIENIYLQCKSANIDFFDKKNTLGLDLTQIPEIK
jgi:protein gp37